MSKLRELREAKGLTRKELAEKAGISLRIIEGLETDPRLLRSVQTLIRLRRVLGKGVIKMLDDVPEVETVRGKYERPDEPNNPTRKGRPRREEQP